jgi:hypothetical protein
VILNLPEDSTSLEVTTKDARNGKFVRQYSIPATKRFYMIPSVSISPSRSQFIFQNSSNAFSMLQGNATLIPDAIKLQPADMINLQHAAATTYDDKCLYILQSSPDGVYCVNLTSGFSTRLYDSADTKEQVGLLVGSMTNDDNYLYYTFGPYGSYAIATQDKKSGNVESITVVRDQDTRDVLMPLHLFTYDGDLMAVLINDHEQEIKTWLARVDPESGQYREEFPFYKVFGSGRVMQRMISIYNKRYLLGWFASSEGSTSKLFVLDLQEMDLVAAVDYYEQQGAWRALGYQC